MAPLTEVLYGFRGNRDEFEVGESGELTEADLVRVMRYPQEAGVIDAVYDDLKRRGLLANVSVAPLLSAVTEQKELGWGSSGGETAWEYSLEDGVWVHRIFDNSLEQYPDAATFAQLRSSRNFPLINEAEQSVMSRARVAMLGLSTGQATARVLAMMGFPNFILIDLDRISVSNGNRMQGRIGENKAVATAKEILRINPFAKLRVWTDGVTEENLAERVRGADVIVEMVDNFGVKVRVQEGDHVPVVTSAGVDFSPTGTVYMGGDDLFGGRISPAEVKLLLSGKVDLPRRVDLVRTIIGGENITDRANLGFQMMIEGKINYLSQHAGGAVGSALLNAFAVVAVVNGYPLKRRVGGRLDTPGVFT